MQYQRLADLRIDHDLTQKQVAQILHCQREVYRRYENGIRELPLSYAIILAEYYNVSLDYLVGRSDEQQHSNRKEPSCTTHRRVRIDPSKAPHS